MPRREGRQFNAPTSWPRPVFSFGWKTGFRSCAVSFQDPRTRSRFCQRMIFSTLICPPLARAPSIFFISEFPPRKEVVRTSFGYNRLVRRAPPVTRPRRCFLHSPEPPFFSPGPDRTKIGGLTPYVSSEPFFLAFFSSAKGGRPCSKEVPFYPRTISFLPRGRTPPSLSRTVFFIS